MNESAPSECGCCPAPSAFQPRGPLLALLLAAASLALACGPEPIDTEELACPGCNVVLVTFDAMRADRLGLYGYPKDTSPELDAFAREAYVFTDAMAQSGSTVNSLPSLFTSKFPFVDRLGNHHTIRLSESETTLPEVLAAQGYATAAVIGWDFAGSEYGLGQGFQIFDEDHDTHETAARTFERSLAVIKQLEEPFFLWIHVREPHDPYDVPDELFDAFYLPGEGGKAGGGGPTLQTSPRSVVLYHYSIMEQVDEYTVISRKPKRYTKSMIQQLGAMYDGNIRQADTAFGGLLRFMDASELAGHTAVIVASDHGESVGEHYRFGHNELYYGIVRVPLMLRLPSRRHAVLSHPVMNVDIFPTVLGLLDIPHNGKIRGVDLFEAERGEYFQFAEYEHRRTIKQGRFKLDLEGKSAEKIQLFDVVADRDESTNLAKSSRDKAAELLRLSEGLVSLDTGQAAPLSDESHSLEELRALGYIE